MPRPFPGVERDSTPRDTLRRNAGRGRCCRSRGLSQEAQKDRLRFKHPDLLHPGRPRLWATYRLKTPDSILIATAVNSEATGFIGNDADLKRITELGVLVLGK